MDGASEQLFGGTARLLALIETIYAAVQQPELWPIALDGIAEAIHGESITIFARLPGDEYLLSMARTDPAAWEAFAGYYASINPIMQSCNPVYGDGEVRYAHHVLEDRTFTRTEFYNDFFRPFDMHHCLGVKMPLTLEGEWHMTCQRPKASGPFTEAEGSVYETLLPHLQRALGLHVQLNKMSAQVLGFEAALDAYDHAVFGLDGNGQVVFANRAAEAVVTKGDALRMVHGRLLACLPEQDRLLGPVLARAVSTGGRNGLAAGNSMLLSSTLRREALRITISPFSSSLPGRSAQLAALVFVSDPESSPRSKAALLATLYGLTPMETRVADLLLQGYDVRALAENLRLTLETARFHTKRVLSKTGARRQTELIRLMLSLPSVPHLPSEISRSRVYGGPQR